MKSLIKNISIGMRPLVTWIYYADDGHSAQSLWNLRANSANLLHDFYDHVFKIQKIVWVYTFDIYDVLFIYLL